VRYVFLLLVFSVLFYLLGCNRRINSPEEINSIDSVDVDIPVFGTDSTLDIVTWNIQNFPKLGQETVTEVAAIMKTLNADVYGIEEIEDTTSFRQLLNLLPAYGGTYSLDIYFDGSYQKTGVIYKKNVVTISDKRMLFTNDSYSFPRPPLQVYIASQSNLRSFDFTFIVLHLKASGGEDNEARRRSACEKLKNYLDIEIAGSADKDYIAVGDWNDELDDPTADNVFLAFLNDPIDYTFLTAPFASDPNNNATYIGGTKSVIDQILISAGARQQYDTGSTRVIKVDQYLASYVYEVSDHRPVGANFPVFK
jgi:endonuclease/exonuclease/phosphatase family metal-dependent hydrolase